MIGKRVVGKLGWWGWGAKQISQAPPHLCLHGCPDGRDTGGAEKGCPRQPPGSLNPVPGAREHQHPRDVPPAGHGEPSCFPCKCTFSPLDKTPPSCGISKVSEPQRAKLARGEHPSHLPAPREGNRAVSVTEGAFVLCSLNLDLPEGGESTLPLARLAQQKGLGAVPLAIFITAAPLRDFLTPLSTVCSGHFSSHTLPAKVPGRARCREVTARGWPHH